MSNLVVVEFCYDFASPYSYLADCLVDKALDGTGGTARRVPVYLRGFQTFREGMPYDSAKAVYLARDMQRCADFHGIPFAAPAQMPVNGLYLLRGAVYLEGREEAERYRQIAFRATWAESRPVSTDEHAADVAVDAGIDRKEFLEGIRQPTVKDTLKESTRIAASRGAFGVPTFFVGTEMYWGHDRLDQIGMAVHAMIAASAR